MGVGGQHHAPAALPPGKTRYPLYRRLGGPQGPSGRVRKISPPQYGSVLFVYWDLTTPNYIHKTFHVSESTLVQYALNILFKILLITELQKCV